MIDQTASKTAPRRFVPEDSIGYQMRLIVNQMAQEVERRMEPLGLTDAQWKPLLRLSLQDGATAALLARNCHLDAGGMTRLLDRLEAKGLCQRERSQEDRRVVHIALTGEGRAAAAQIPEQLESLQAQALQGFSAAEEAQLRQFLRRIRENVQALNAAAADGDAGQ